MIQRFGRANKLTRRNILCSVAAISLAPGTNTLADSELLALGQEFSVVSAGLDLCLDHKLYIPEWLIDRLGPVLRAIEQSHATTMDGLLVKAQAVNWNLLGDLSPSSTSSAAERLMLTMIRDLMQTHRPDLA